jgi:hypothetical protein
MMMPRSLPFPRETALVLSVTELERLPVADLKELTLGDRLTRFCGVSEPLLTNDALDPAGSAIMDPRDAVVE